MSENDLSRKIRDLRAMHHLTLEDVAQQVGVGRSTVRKWETGMIENMRRDKIAKLATALHTTPAYLMGWQEADYIPCNLFSPLRGLRETLELTPAQVSAKTGIPLETYLAIENGQNTDCITLSKLALFFHCSTDHILSFDGVCNEEDNIAQARLALLDNKPGSGHHVLSEEESDLVCKFRCLDDRGKSAVLNVLNHEYESLPGEKAHPTPKEA